MANRIVQAIYDLKDNITGKLRTISESMKGNARVADETAAKTEKSNQRVSESYKKTADSLGFLRKGLAALGVAFSLNTVKDAIVGILGVGDAAERTKLQLAQLYGTQEAGNKAYEDLRKLAKETGQSFQGVLEAATRLKATGLEPLDGTLKSLINQTAALGGSQETLTGIGLALGQMYAKQKIQTEEILQLVERGVPAFDLLAKVTGKQGAELQKLIQSGNLGRDAIRGLIQEIGRASDGAAAKSINTLGSLVTQLKDQFNEFLERIANSGAADFFKEKLKGIRNEIELMVRDGRLQKFAEDTSNSITKLGESISAVVEKWRILSGASDVATGAVATAFNATLKTITSASAGVTGLFTKLTGAGEEAAKTFEQLDKVAGDRLSAAFEKMSEGARRIAEGLGLIRKKSDELKPSFDNVVSGADSTASAFANIEKGVSSTAPLFDELAAAAKRSAEAIAQAENELTAAKVKVDEAMKAIADLSRANVTHRQSWKDADEALKAANAEFDAAKKKLADLTGETAKAEAATKALADAYKTLKVTSQADLDKAAAAAEKAFETIVQASYRGEAAASDVSRAFAAFAAAERARVADGDERAKREIERHLRVAASAAGLLAEYERLGEGGKKAGEETVKSFEVVKEKIDAAADSAAKLGAAAEGAASDLSTMGQSANTVNVAVNDAGVGLGYMTDQAREALAAAEGFDGIDRVMRRYADEIFETREELEAFTRAQQEAADAAASAASEIDELTKRLRAQRDAATLSEEELERRRYEEEIARIDELAKTAGASARAQAAELRALAAAEHRRRMKEIAEEARARRASNADSDNEESSGSNQSGAGAGIPGTHQSTNGNTQAGTGLHFAPTIVINGGFDLSDDKDRRRLAGLLVRDMHSAIQGIQRRS